MSLPVFLVISHHTACKKHWRHAGQTKKPAREEPTKDKKLSAKTNIHTNVPKWQHHTGADGTLAVATCIPMCDQKHKSAELILVASSTAC